MIGKLTDENYIHWDKYIKCLLHKWKTPANLYDDYIQEMFLTLCECNNSYREDMTCNFDTYAYNNMHWKYIKLMNKYYDDKCIVDIDAAINSQYFDDDIIDIHLTIDEANLLEMYKSLGIDATAKHYNVSKTTIYNRIKKIKNKIKKQLFAEV